MALKVTVDDRRRDGSVRFSVEGRVDRREWGVGDCLPGMRLGNHISIRAAICAVPAYLLEEEGMRNLVLRVLRVLPSAERGCSAEQLAYAQRESA